MAILTGNVVINTSSSGDQTVADAPGAGKNYRIVGYKVASAASTEVTLKSSGGTVVVPPTQETTVAGGGAAIAPSQEWMIDLPANEALVLNNSAAVKVTGHLTLCIRG